jgi:hypothetical protein
MLELRVADARGTGKVFGRPASRLLAPLMGSLLLPGFALTQGSAVTPDGQKGELHVVVGGDTLWDITHHYIETPWIWPSIWKENANVANPHLIYPAEGGYYPAAPRAGGGPYGIPGLPMEHMPQGPLAHQYSQYGGAPDAFAGLDQAQADVQRVVRYPGIDRASYMTAEEIVGAASILGSHEEHYWAAQGQRTIVSLGEGQVHVGDRFTVFRTRRRVFHPDSGRVLGYLTQNLGHVEVTEIHPESSYVKVVDSYSEIEPGDRVMPYEETPTKFVEQRLEIKLKGTIVAHQHYRIYSAWNDFVVLDRGSTHGVELGNRFGIYREGKEVREPLTASRVLVPDDVIGQLFVVKVTPKSSLALITRSHRKIREGDRFRNL